MLIVLSNMNKNLNIQDIKKLILFYTIWKLLKQIELFHNALVCIEQVKQLLNTIAI